MAKLARRGIHPNVARTFDVRWLPTPVTFTCTMAGRGVRVHPSRGSTSDRAHRLDEIAMVSAREDVPRSRARSC